jgi:gas vesicle protein
MRFIIIVGGIVLSVVLASRVLRRRRSGPMRRARKEMQKAVSEVESSLAELAQRAKKLRGEARETIEVQIRALEGRRDQLMERIQAMAEETRKRARKQREEVAAGA